jgi:hypothetical protein
MNTVAASSLKTLVPIEERTGYHIPEDRATTDLLCKRVRNQCLNVVVSYEHRDDLK